jgi:hypothetical protein
MQSKPRTDIIFLILILLAVCLFAMRGLMIDKTDIVSAIKDKGYTKPLITETDILTSGWSGCDANDAAAFKGTAEYTVGKQVNIIACANWPLDEVTIYITKPYQKDKPPA